jgi:UrcA family protein
MTKLQISAIVAVALSTFAAAPAAAEPVTIAYGDLNVTTEAGAQVLAQRFDAGVDTACARPDIRDVKANAEFAACRAEAVNSAAQQLNQAGALTGASKLLAVN